MKKHKIQGFTLIELMVVLIIISIIAAIAYPSYNQYILKKDLAVAQKEALRISTELERFKAKNFSYKGFNPTFVYADYDEDEGSLLLPVGSDEASAKFVLTLVDLDSKEPLTIEMDADGKETAASEGINGLGWAMTVVRAEDSDGNGLKQPGNYDLLITSEGLKCKTKYSGEVDEFESCGASSEGW